MDRKPEGSLMDPTHCWKASGSFAHAQCGLDAASLSLGSVCPAARLQVM